MITLDILYEFLLLIDYDDHKMQHCIVKNLFSYKRDIKKLYSTAQETAKLYS